MPAFIDSILNTANAISNWIWGIPMLILLGIGGTFLSARLGFFQFRHLGFILKRKWAQMREPKKGEKVSGFQAMTAALGNTLGPGNIAGTPVAIALGGPGGLFWMFIVGLISSGTKFCEVTLAMKYRTKDLNGEYLGGPVQYLSKCFKKPWLGTFYCYALIIGMCFHLMYQSTSIADMGKTVSVPPIVTGVLLMVAAGAVVMGGIHRLAKVTEKMVPFMALFYIVGGLIVIAINYDRIIPSLTAMVTQAFTGSAAIGGFAGSTIASAFRWGLARGTASNDAGNGLASIVHSSTEEDVHPVEQGLWGVIEVFLDTNVVCMITGLVVLTSGIWTELPSDQASTFAGLAFERAFGGVAGSAFVTFTLFLFVFSSVIAIIYMTDRMVMYAWGPKAVLPMRIFYLLLLPLGSVCGLSVIIRVLDLASACFMIPNMIGLLMKSGEIKTLVNDYFSNPEYYSKAKIKESRK